MNFDSIKEIVQTKFKDRIEVQALVDQQIFNNLPEDQSIALQYIYAYSDIADLASYEFSYFSSIANHSINLLNQFPWTYDISPDHFLPYIVQPRVSNEKLCDCRDILYFELLDFIQGKNVAEAALAVNYYCFSKATYKATSRQTMSVKALMNNCYGRCGEEAVLLVNALRSVGFASRQVHVPRWSHQDSNHCWVEVLIDGKWRFMGACEPEVQFDRGWFVGPASRALVVVANVYGIFVPNDQNANNLLQCCFEVNVTSHYAPTRNVSFFVQQSDGQPCNNCNISIEVFNADQMLNVYTLITDEAGNAGAELGFGTFYITAVCDEHICCQLVAIDATEVHIVMSKSMFGQQLQWFPAKETPMFVYESVCQENQLEHDAQIQFCDKMRQDFQGTFFDQGKANIFVNQLFMDIDQFTKDRICSLLHKSRGNFNTLITLFSDKTIPINYSIYFLESIHEKELLDIDADLIRDHLYLGVQQKYFKYHQEFFLNPISAPEFYLYKERQLIIDLLGDETIQQLKEDPQFLVQYLSCFPNSFDKIQNQQLSVYGLLRLGSVPRNDYGRCLSMIGKSIGVPIQLTPFVAFHKDNQWIPFEDTSFLLYNTQQTGFIIFQKVNFQDCINDDNVVLQIQEGNLFHAVSFNLQFNVRLQVPVSRYRLITSTRGNGGDALVNIEYVQVFANLPSLIKVSQPQFRLQFPRVGLSQLLHQLPLTQLQPQIKPLLLLYVKTNVEPTEHIVREFKEIDVAKMYGLQLFIDKLDDLQNPSLQTFINLFNEKCFKQTLINDVIAYMQQLFSIEVHLPCGLLIVNDDVYLVINGYQVGSVALLSQFLQQMGSQ